MKRRGALIRPDGGSGVVQPNGQEPLQVLLVDDSPCSLSLYEVVLAQLLGPAVVRTAPSGKEALAALREQPADLLISDYHMPSMNGLQLIGEAARRGLARRRVLFSSDADPWLPARAHDVGAHAFFSKNDMGRLRERLPLLVAPIRA